MQEKKRCTLSFNSLLHFLYHFPYFRFCLVSMQNLNAKTQLGQAIHQ